MKKIIFASLASCVLAFSFDFSKITCDSFDVKIRLMGEELMPSEIVALHNGESVYIYDVAGRPGFRITKDGFITEYSAAAAGSRHTYTNMKKESEQNDVIKCTMTRTSEYWESENEPKREIKKIFYTISQNIDEVERLIVKVKE